MSYRTHTGVCHSDFGIMTNSVRHIYKYKYKYKTSDL